jgi:hypothetical protein
LDYLWMRDVLGPAIGAVLLAIGLVFLYPRLRVLWQRGART